MVNSIYASDNLLEVGIFCSMRENRRLSLAKIVAQKSKCPGHTSFVQMNPLKSGGEIMEKNY